MIVSNINKKSLLLAYLFLLSNLVFSQNVEFKNANFKEDKEGLKLAKEDLAIADDLRNCCSVQVLVVDTSTFLKDLMEDNKLSKNLF